MTTIAGSAATLATGTPGTPFTAAGTTIAVDVDEPGAKIFLETQRASGDSVWKPVSFGRSGDSPYVFTGPGHHLLQTIAGRRYRIVCQTGPATVAADE